MLIFWRILVLTETFRRNSQIEAYFRQQPMTEQYYELKMLRFVQVYYMTTCSEKSKVQQH